MPMKKGSKNRGSGDYWRGYRQARIDFLLVGLDSFKNVLEEYQYRPEAYYKGMLAYYNQQKRILKNLMKGENHDQ